MALDVSPARPDELDALLPLVAGYQRFYGVERPDDEKNRAFFARFLAPSDDGLLLAARDPAPEVVGFATLYWTFSSVSAEPHAIMNDLFVRPEVRGRGVGAALIEASRVAARDRGIERMSWMTALDNRVGQRLYEKTHAERGAWFEYELDTAQPSAASHGGG